MHRFLRQLRLGLRVGGDHRRVVHAGEDGLQGHRQPAAPQPRAGARALRRQRRRYLFQGADGLQLRHAQGLHARGYRDTRRLHAQPGLPPGGSRAPGALSSHWIDHLKGGTFNVWSSLTHCLLLWCLFVC